MSSNYNQENNSNPKDTNSEAVPPTLSSGFKRLLISAASSVIVLIAAVLILAVTSSKTDTSVPLVPNSTQVAPIMPLVPTKPPLPGKLDLSYPGATALKVSNPVSLDLQHLTNLQTMSFGAYATTDSDTQIVDYYDRLLTKAGYNLTQEGAVAVEGALYVEATKDNFMLDIAVAPAGTWQFTVNGPNSEPFYSLADQLKPNQALIYFAYGPTNNAPLPTPTELPSQTPVSANSVAYLGPDNQFHADSGLGLVSTGASESAPAVFTETELSQSNHQSVQLTITNFTSSTVKEKASTANQTITPMPSEQESSNPSVTPSLLVTGTGKAQINWLVSDPDGFKADVMLSGTGFSNIIASSSPKDYGTLTDDKGHSYFISSVTKAYDLKSNVHWIIQGKPLSPSIHKVTFTPGPVLSFKVNGSLSLNLATFQQAKLPRGVPIPNGNLHANGVNLSVSYAYFGKDRTVLAVHLDDTQLVKEYAAKNLEVSLYPLIATDANRDENLRVADDTGKILLPLPDSPTETLFDELPFSGNQTLILSPTTSSAKSFNLSLSNIEFSLSATPSANISQQNSFKLPIADLIKSGAEESLDQTLTFADYKVHIVGARATFDQTVPQYVDVDIQYQAQPIIANSNVVDAVFFDCLQCKGSDYATTASIDSPNENMDNKVHNFNTSFQYNPSRTTEDFSVNGMLMRQSVNGQLTLPIPSTNP